MAFYELEPCGEQLADLRHGIATMVFANAHRDPKTRPNPFVPSDFIWWGSHAEAGKSADEPLLLEDSAAQAALIKATMFGKTN
jgi:hypothetical protein